VIYLERLVPFTFDSKRLKTGGLGAKMLENKRLAGLAELAELGAADAPFR
jgi:hypothetical protein